MKRTVAILGVGLFMGAIALTYPLAREPGSALPGNLGDPLLNSWALAWGSERIADGFAGFWDAPVFFPHHDSLAFSESLAGVAVFVAPIQWVLGNPILTYNVAFLFSFVHFGLGVFLLTRSVAGRTDAAVIAAVAATFSPYRTASQITFLQMQIAGWIPLGLWALHRYFTTGSRRALLASTAAIVLQILTSLYFAYLLLVPLSVIAVHGLLGDRESRMRRLRDLSGGAVIAMAVVGSVAAVYYRVQQQHGLVWPLDEHRRYSADVLSYVHVRQGADTWIDLPQEATAVRALFPGTALLVLGILGSAVCCLRSERRTNTKAPGSGTRDSGSRNQGPGVRLGRIYALIGIVSLALSLGPQPSVAGHAFLPSGPYAWLMAVLPGLSGFRIPARFGIMVHLSLAVLAAIGAAWLLSRTKARSWRLTLCAGLVIVGLVDGYTGPVRLPRFDPRGRQASHDLYEWLKAHPGPAIVLPIADADAAVKALAGESLARVYHYGSAVHGQPLVNGSTDFKPAFVRFLEGDASPVRSLADLPQGLRMLSDLGVRHVIVHRQDFENAAFADAIVGRIRSTPDIVTSERRFGETLLFGLAPPSSHATRGKAEPPRGVPLPLESFKIRASHRSDRARFAVDGSLETRWISGSRQTGEEWLELAFAEPRDVAHVRLSFHSGSLGDYPRGLRIETSEDGRTYRPLVAETPLPRLARSLIQSPRTPHIHIALSSNRSRLLRLRQTGTSRSWQWAANEIEVWQRPDTGS